MLEKEFLQNAKPEELVKYSKGTYNKERYISRVADRWELSDKQIRMVYLTADLAQKANGVFSVSNEKFREMFENRFKLTISRATVQRFFRLLEELQILTVNEGRRKNRTQSANIFIIEPMEQEVSEEPKVEVETPDDTPYETLNNTPTETHNIVLTKSLTKALTKPLSNINCNYKEPMTFKKFKVLLTNACNEFYTTYSVGRYSKNQWNTLIGKFVNDSIERGYYKTVPEHKIKGFAYKSLEIIVDNSDYKRSDEYAAYLEVMKEVNSNTTRTNFPTGTDIPLYNWLEQ
ncbi:hypothetical protein NDK43_06635 [Neobacillus pocheonensis]|uniref:Helix-turn-helix domain-containing protein n=1 Tax=Neobacillus pocheonensis TaxID=363869 RepID=A0ABT0W734_9BACI|nr:hypothetical protein [Neobacillus pocheonensis]